MKKPAAKVAKLSSLTSASWTVPKRWVFLSHHFPGVNSLFPRGYDENTRHLKNHFFWPKISFQQTHTHKNFALQLGHVDFFPNKFLPRIFVVNTNANASWNSKKNSGPFFLVHVPKVWWFVAAWIPPDHLDPTACPPDKPGPTKVQGVLSAAEQLSRSD